MNSPAKTGAETCAWNFLLAASSPGLGDGESIQHLLNEPVDWPRVLHLADQHGVTSLLYQNVLKSADSIPSTVIHSLREKYEASVHKALFLTRELIRVLDSLDGLGVEAVAYKGVALSEIYYGDMAVRPGGDVDLFVRVQDVTRAKNAMQDLGYTSRLEIAPGMEEAYIAAGYEWTFDSPAGNNLLELQWALQPRFYAVDFDMGGLSARAEWIEFAGRKIRTPSAEDLLIVLSLHAAKHVWGRLIWLCDIARISQGELDWDRVRNQARQLGIERILHVTLLLGNRLLGMEIPETILSDVQDDRATREFTEKITSSIADGVSYEEEKMSYFRLMMELRERRWDRVRFFTRLAFTPGPGEWAAVQLPRVLFPFYRVVRLARLAASLAQG